MWYEIKKVFGYVSISEGTGKLVALMVYQMLGTWQIMDKIIGLSIDPLCANSDRESGPNVCSEVCLNRPLL